MGDGSWPRCHLLNLWIFPHFLASELLLYLKNAKKVIPAEMGHVGYIRNVQPEVTTKFLVGFYNTGEIDSSIYILANELQG